MTVKLRLVLAFAILILMSLIIGLSALKQISEINGSLSFVVQDRVPKVLQLEEINMRRAINERDIARLILARDESERQDSLKLIKEAMEQNRLSYEQLSKTITSKQGVINLEAVLKLRKEQSGNNVEMLALVSAGKQEEALAMFMSEKVRKTSTDYGLALQTFTNYQIKASEQSADEGQKAAESATFVTISILIISLIIGIFFFLWIMRVVVRPVVEMQQAMQAVVLSGQFNKQLTVLNQDEIGMSVQALNELLKSMQHAVADANSTVGALAQGDFSKRIERQYVGDLDSLKNGINASADNVTKVMRELGRVMQALKAGQFNVKVDASAEGEYRTMLTNTSEAMTTINSVIGNINKVMEAMQNGQFQQRVSVEARGELDLMKQRINGSMEELNEAMQEIIRVVVAQSEGDLTHVIQAHYHGDLETLKKAVNHTAEKLVEVVAKAVDASNIVSVAAEEVSRGSSDLSSRVQEQAAALEQTSATMDEMNSAVQANTENAQQAANVAKDVQKRAHDGSEVMQQTIEAMNSIQESSHKIADIVTLIDGIAFQTNLLALNAAVEAARAGDHGRGFAVVAGEVRALAQKSADAAKDIKTLIDESVSRISHGTQLASQSGEMLNTINQSIDSVTQMVGQIAGASAEQAHGVTQVHQAISQIDQVTQQNAALVEQTTSAAESMMDQSIVLREDMAFFKTGVSSTSATQQRAKPRTVAPTAGLPKAKSAIKKVAQPGVKTLANKSSVDDSWDDF